MRTIKNRQVIICLFNNANRLTQTGGALPVPMPFLSPSGGPPPGCTLPTAIGDTRVISYTYNPLSRLTSAAYSSGECYQYGYDRVGNRTVQTATITSQVVTNYAYDPANRLSSVNGQAYTWDDNGNLINDGTAWYRYDQANRLISTTLNSTTSLFNYNGDGVRLKQIVAGTITTYTQDLAAPLPVVLQSKTGTTITQYLYSTGTGPLAQYTSGAGQYLLPDALGSVRQIVDANGNVTLVESYEPYGEPLWSSGNGRSVYNFTGEERDSTGLIFLRARYMQPSLGIFLSRDPASGDVMQPGSMKGFNYVEGNPINATDPSGQAICLPPNHWEEVYDWSEGRKEVVGLHCVPPGPDGAQPPLPPAFETIAKNVPISPAGVFIVAAGIIGYICLEAAVQQGAQVQPRIGLSAQSTAVPIPIPIRRPYPAETPGLDFIWRGIDDPTAKPRHFKPIAPKDANGLSFYEGRANMWAQSRKPFRAGFTRSALIAAGFSVFRDDFPPGHTSVKRLNNQEWEGWLYANNPQHPYQQTLASMVAIVEPNAAP